MPEKILQDDQLDKQLLETGFAVVSFLNQKETSALVDFFYQHHPNGVSGFYATAHSHDIAFRNRMNDEIKKNFQRAIGNYFHKCTALGGSFVVKSNTQKERLHPHQDWNIVDEEQHRSFNIWVPLVDLTEKNGTIRVMPGSHRWVKNYRGPNIPDLSESAQEQIWQRMTPLYMKAGEALIYDHRLFHASDSNTTDELRIATVFGIIPERAQMLYYYGNGKQVEIYKSSANFFLNENMQKGNLILQKVNTVQLPVVSFSQFLQLEETSVNRVKKTGLFNFIRRLF
ncbi:MAG: phytanoyl-CoA dioxygenase family protein [Chitinophagales bacterium]|nr:phytanoyl-CoA dioxygenase family protein [Chitinophagales bacterium]